MPAKLVLPTISAYKFISDSLYIESIPYVEVVQEIATILSLTSIKFAQLLLPMSKLLLEYKLEEELVIPVVK